MQRAGNIPNTITLQGLPIQLPVHPQPGVRSWCPINSENNSSFSLELLLSGLSSYTNHEREIQPLLQPGNIEAHVIPSRGCPKHRAADEARLRGKASSDVDPRQGHSSKGGMLHIRSKHSAGSTAESLGLQGFKDSAPLGCSCKRHLIST